MRSAFRAWLVAAGLFLIVWAAPAQQNAPPPAPPPASPPAFNPTDVVATVNGQPILEIQVQRIFNLQHIPAARQAEVRPKIVGFLVDNAVVDQYLSRSVTVDPKEVDGKVQEIREDIQKHGSTFEKEMQAMMITEPDLRVQITNELRIEKYVNQKATDAVLQDVFAKNREVFDGTTVRARHILLTPPAGDAAANEAARAKLTGFKKQIEDEVNAGLAKLPPGTNNLAREETRWKLTDEAFSRIARTASQCPSRNQDGDLGYFPRAGVGSMVEAFSRAAFSLKPYQVSDVVTTQFGHHLILVLDRRQGREVKFEEVKEAVKEMYAEQVRTALAAQLRPAAQVKMGK